MQCLVETGKPNFASVDIALIPDDGAIELNCDRGHHTWMLLQQTKYEILSEVAITALCDGYYREAVVSFASALERLYEHYVHVVCRARNIDREVLAAAWKPLRKLSERQLGAFSMLYLIETGRPFSFLGEKHVAFRNEVVHLGIIPDRKQAVAYGQAVGDCATPLIAELHSARYAEIQEVLIKERLDDRSELARKAGSPHSTEFLSTPLSFNPSLTGFDLESLLVERATRPDMAGTVAESHSYAQTLAASTSPRLVEQPPKQTD
jgi:hypothetical protein